MNTLIDCLTETTTNFAKGGFAFCLACLGLVTYAWVVVSYNSSLMIGVWVTALLAIPFLLCAFVTMTASLIAAAVLWQEHGLSEKMPYLDWLSRHLTLVWHERHAVATVGVATIFCLVFGIPIFWALLPWLTLELLGIGFMLMLSGSPVRLFG